ncbi:MAG: hypothetical protein AB7I18_14445 [Candidatus Berkiella sp.]
MRLSRFILLFSVFGLSLFTSAHAQDKLVTTPYFQVNLPQEIVLRKTASQNNGKTYLYAKTNQDGVMIDYLFGFFVEKLDNKKLKNKKDFLEEDVIETFKVYANKHDRSLNGNDPKQYIKDIKIGDLDFKMLRTPGSRMETLATVHNGQFYRVYISAVDPKNMDRLHKSITESLQLTNKQHKQQID